MRISPIRTSTLALALALSVSSVLSANAFAGELDNESSVTNIAQRAQDLPATVVVRVSADDQSVAVLHSNELLAAQETALSDAQFVPMKADGSMTGIAKSELDKDSSTNSWYFYFNYYNYSYPTYYYYTYRYSYVPYYSYFGGGYYYYYYRYRW